VSAALTLLLACGGTPSPAPVAVPASERLPREARVWYLRARFAEARGHLAAADRAMAWVDRLDRGSPWAWVHLAEHRLARGDWAEAVSAGEQALDREALPAAHRVVGLAQAALGAPEALEHLLAADGLPGVLAARVRLGGPVEGAALLHAAPPASSPEELDCAAAALAVGLPQVARDRAMALLEDPAWGPDALALAVRAAGCDLAPVQAWAAQPRWQHRDRRWEGALAAIATAVVDCAQAEP